MPRTPIRHKVLLALAALCLPLKALAQEPLPLPPPPLPPPARRDQAPAARDGVNFGSDVSAGYLLGSLIGPWPEKGLHGAVFGRYDAFLVARDHSGWRLGLSLFGGRSLAPLQNAVDRDDTGAAAGPAQAIRFTQFGAMTVLRPDPELPLGPLFGVGFSRLDISEGYYGGPVVLPLATFELGARQRLPKNLYLDWTLRPQWATDRSGQLPNQLEEWWLFEGGLQLGWHLR